MHEEALAATKDWFAEMGREMQQAEDQDVSKEDSVCGAGPCVVFSRFSPRRWWHWQGSHEANTVGDYSIN